GGAQHARGAERGQARALRIGRRADLQRHAAQRVARAAVRASGHRFLSLSVGWSALMTRTAPGARAGRRTPARDPVTPCPARLLRRRAGFAMCIPKGYTRAPAMTSSTVFTTNRSQAVRLPKAVAFPDDVHQVDILKIGRSRVIVPQGRRWDDLFATGPRASEDFLAGREQPAAGQRESL